MGKQQNSQTILAMTSPPPNKREEILLAASKLFRKKGYSGTSMQDIADAVDLLKGSLYHHFSGKEELIDEILNSGIDKLIRINSQVFEQIDLGPRDKLRELIKRHILHLTANNESLVIATNELDKLSESRRESYLSKRKEYNKLWIMVLKEGVQQGEFPSIDVELTSRAIRGMMNWLIQWYKQDGPFQSDYIADYFSNLICDLMLGKIHLENCK